MSYASMIAAALRTADLVAGVTVRYRAGADEIEIKNVRPARTRAETVDGQGTMVRGRIQDFLIEASKLVLPGVTNARPKDGHQILQTVGTQIFVYEVRPVGGQKSWDWHDDTKQWFRIHTQHVSTENPTE